MQDRFFSDEELTAFLDGEFDFTPTTQIERALQDDPALRTRIAALRVDRSAIRKAFEDLQPDTISIPVAVHARPRRFFVALGAGVFAAVFAFGVFVGSFRDTGLDGWMDYAAAYHALYSTNTLAYVDQSRPEIDQELDRVTASIGKSISVEALSAVPDVDYLRAQILEFEGQALVQLSFVSGTGVPIALCIMRSYESDDQPPAVMRMEGMASAVWSREGYEYLLIGGRSEVLIEQMAEALVQTGV